MSKKIEKEVRFLKLYAGFITVAMITILFFLINQNRSMTLDELTVERINVVERNGDLKLVISNSEKQHPGIVNGKMFPPRDRHAGLIFFNSAGDECGGLVYDGNEQEAGWVLSVDKYRDDQVMQLQYLENTASNQRKYGLQFWDYPIEDGYDARAEAQQRLLKMTDKTKRDSLYLILKKEGLFPESRMFVGKQANDEYGLFIYDALGAPRIKLYIDKENHPVFTFLDADGQPLPLD